MSKPNPEDLSQLSMMELFRIEADNQITILTAGLLEIERGQGTSGVFEDLMRAAHSLKGAARIVNLPSAVYLAHAMEDCFVAAQGGAISLRQPQADVLFQALDLLTQFARTTDTASAPGARDLDQVLAAMAELLPASHRTFAPPMEGAAAKEGSLDVLESPALKAGVGNLAFAEPAMPSTLAIRKPETTERILRLTAENLNRRLGLAGESLVESRWLRPYAESLNRLKRNHAEMRQRLDTLRQNLDAGGSQARAKSQFNELYHQLADAQEFLADRVQELDMFDRRFTQLSQRLYLEVLRTRMRPFSEGVRRFPRMIRDLSVALGKQVRLEVFGEATQVDRDILERLETPLAHLLRNAVDHGCERPADRSRAGKTEEALIRIEARHSAGVLLVTVSDDGAGVDFAAVRAAVVERHLVSATAAQQLNDSELLEFLFLPGFTLKDKVTEISGRGVGLDVVQNMIKSVRGSIRLSNQPGKGLRVQLQLPLTLSVLRALLVEIAGEPYAVPLTQLARTLKFPRSRLESVEGRSYFTHAGQHIGLLTAHQVLDVGGPELDGEELSVVLIGDRAGRYGLVVDEFLGERELVVQPLDPRLGHVRDISAAALMEDGTPVLILDIEDMVRSIESLLADTRFIDRQRLSLKSPAPRRKRILAVDDSLTVRELQRKILTSHGYLADVAVDGLDGWNAVRTGQYDLVITDIDMPRMDGIDLVTRIKSDELLKAIPVLILSYKDAESDRIRGLDAGADYYLTKGGFHDERLIQAVRDLIGGPTT